MKKPLSILILTFLVACNKPSIEIKGSGGQPPINPGKQTKVLPETDLIIGTNTVTIDSSLVNGAVQSFKFNSANFNSLELRITSDYWYGQACAVPEKFKISLIDNDSNTMLAENEFSHLDLLKFDLDQNKNFRLEFNIPEVNCDGGGLTFSAELKAKSSLPSPEPKPTPDPISTDERIKLPDSDMINGKNNFNLNTSAPKGAYKEYAFNSESNTSISLMIDSAMWMCPDGGFGPRTMQLELIDGLSSEKLKGPYSFSFLNSVVFETERSKSYKLRLSIESTTCTSGSVNFNAALN